MAERQNTDATLSAVDLFSGCGGMSLGFQNAGFNVIHVRLQRDEAQQDMPEEQRNHPSETAMDDCDPNILLVNNGDLQELRSKIAELIEGGVL